MNNIISIKYNINCILQKKVELELFRSKQQHYEQGERAGKILANRVKKLASQNIIPSIYNTENNLVIGKKEINNVFVDFYKMLYTSQGEVETSQYEFFFTSLDIPQISEPHRDLMEMDITIEEVIKAIHGLRPGRSPGEDGYSPDFYKKFCEILAPRLLTVYHYATKKE